jgi:16S rRNA (cytidine1402-2'-O)-methyltransferase
MTKIHETFYREKLKDFEGFKNIIKGELTVVLSRNEEQYSLKKSTFNKEKLTLEITKYLKRYTLKDVVKLISEKNNLPKKQVYDLCLKIKK